jgi:hypothetical protein
MARPAALAHRATPGDGLGVAADLRPAGRVERARRKSEPGAASGFARERSGDEFRSGLRPRRGRGRPPLDQQSPDPHARWSVRRHALPRRARRRSRGTGTRPIVLPRARSKQAELIGIWKRILGRNATDLAYKPGLPRIAPCPLSDRARSGAPGRQRRWPSRNATAGAIARPSTGIAQPAAGRSARSDRACLPYRTGANLTVSGRYPGMPVHFAGGRHARRVAKMSSVPAV